MISPALAEAFVHRPHTVMLRRLRPFTLRRLFALTILDSPLLGGREVRWADLELAVTVCAIRDPLRCLHTLRRHRTLRGRLLRHFRPAALEAESRKFLAYRRDYEAMPPADESPASPHEGDDVEKAPWILRVHESLRAAGYRPDFLDRLTGRDPAWDMPVGEAMHRHIAIEERAGKRFPSLFSEADLALLDEARTR